MEGSGINLGERGCWD